MNTQSMGRRLDKVTSGGDSASYIEALEAGGIRAKAWYAAGNTDPTPFDPLPDLPANAPRAQRELHAAMAAARDRVRHMRAET